MRIIRIATLISILAMISIFQAWFWFFIRDSLEHWINAKINFKWLGASRNNTILAMSVCLLLIAIAATFARPTGALTMLRCQKREFWLFTLWLSVMGFVATAAATFGMSVCAALWQMSANISFGLHHTLLWPNIVFMGLYYLSVFNCTSFTVAMIGLKHRDVEEWGRSIQCPECDAAAIKTRRDIVRLSATRRVTMVRRFVFAGVLLTAAILAIVTASTTPNHPVYTNNTNQIAYEFSDRRFGWPSTWIYNFERSNISPDIADWNEVRWDRSAVSVTVDGSTTVVEFGSMLVTLALAACVATIVGWTLRLLWLARVAHRQSHGFCRNCEYPLIPSNETDVDTVRLH